MNFIDETINFVKAGNGGNGIVAFRKEKYVPYGGPSGGNGGQGGSVFFVGDAGMNTLFKLQYQRKISSFDGNNGKNKNQNGAKGEDLFIKVPLGTLVFDNENNNFIGEVLEHGFQLLIAKGGKGGRGNYSLSNSKNKTISFAEKGELGQSLTIRTELKILADVGLVGLPNVGKSSLISSISNVKSKVGSYSFTTVKPFLGVFRDQDFFCTIADIPGLIKNSSLGKGMGINFLKHIERCKILIHICSIENDDIYKNYFQVNEELKKYNPHILQKPQIILVNKMDLDDSEEKLIRFRQNFPQEQLIIPFSVHTRFNFDFLKDKIKEVLNNYKAVEPVVTPKNYKLFTLENEQKIVVYKKQTGYFVVEGEKIKKMFYKTDLNNFESVKRFSCLLKKMGVEEELRKQGMNDEDKVEIYGYIFELVD
ncbi:GTPase ObgE ['Camptotheca acuminata' phytoplasma]|uniref:GTPase ObgE n=1 Tax='Camptotheca acuminata' phytoplasma TaxID=3239192 RepID=UPI00351A789D